MKLNINWLIVATTLLVTGCHHAQNVRFDEDLKRQVTEVNLIFEDQKPFKFALSAQLRDMHNITPEFQSSAASIRAKFARENIRPLLPNLIVEKIQKKGKMAFKADGSAAVDLVVNLHRVEANISSPISNFWYQVALIDKQTKKELWGGEFGISAFQQSSKVDDDALVNFADDIASSMAYPGFLKP